ncbi:MAG: sulfatase-like hydrolase/transferase, partial [Bacteroidota bacterium]
MHYNRLLLCYSLFLTVSFSTFGQTAENLPNILWITCEDLNAYLGSYGDTQAITPNLDRLASEGVRYTQAFAPAPVCSPARSALITGIYATSMGTQHLRSEVEIPNEVRALPYYLRDVGYYCTNNSKEDYNFQDEEMWDESSKRAHWRNRPEGGPFFSVFNIETTHQSKIFGTDQAFYDKYSHQLSEEEQHDPDEMELPPYFFDTPVTRKMWTRYYDLVTIMDRQVQDILDQLQEDGLAEKTIVFFFADHGTGMPRGKRALYDSGLKVPFLVKAPSSYQRALDLVPGTQNDRLVNFVDFAPTVLSIIGQEAPDQMQGVAFLGEHQQPTPEYVFATSDRVDEAFEISRSVRSQRFLYIRNYLPHLPLIQPNFYTDQSEVMVELRRVLAEGDLTPAQQHMWAPTRPEEELYDTEADPYQVNNLADDPEYATILTEMRTAQQQWASETHDSGLIPESMMQRLAEGRTIYEMVRDTKTFPIKDILGITDLSLPNEKLTVQMVAELMKSENPIIRYWSVIGLGSDANLASSVRPVLQKHLNDPFPSVQIKAAELLCQSGECDDALPLLIDKLDSEGATMLMAARAIQQMGEAAKPVLSEAQEKQQRLCKIAEDRSQYYELYACWALSEWM